MRTTVSTQKATSPTSTKSRNWDSSVSRGTNSNWYFGLIWMCTEECEILELVDFGSVEFSVKSVRSSPKLPPTLLAHLPFSLTYPFRSLTLIHLAWPCSCARAIICKASTQGTTHYTHACFTKWDYLLRDCNDMSALQIMRALSQKGPLFGGPFYKKCFFKLGLYTKEPSFEGALWQLSLSRLWTEFEIRFCILTEMFVTSIRFRLGLHMEWLRLVGSLSL